jgi:4-hydroxybenzoate polyprenyltransferase
LRPRQWSKNLILFAGLIFAKKFFEPDLVLKAVSAFVDFCILASSIYIFNDLKDIESDKLHPTKKFRPIPSGKISPHRAVILGIILAVLSLLWAYYIERSYFLLCAIYFLGMLSYSFFLKHVVIIDIMIIAGGFVLRAVAGALAVGVTISSWLLVCGTFLALFLIISKRRHEVILLGEEAKSHRKILEEYGDRFLDQMIAIVTAATLISYMLYTVDPQTISKFGTHNLLLTAPFVLYGIFRYLYLVFQKNKGGHPEQVLLEDPPLIIAIALWVVTAIVIIY